MEFPYEWKLVSCCPGTLNDVIKHLYQKRNKHVVVRFIHIKSEYTLFYFKKYVHGHKLQNVDRNVRYQLFLCA